MGVPLIQAELGEHIAGVTLRVGTRRAIVLNIGGANRHVYQRRTTIAHKLGISSTTLMDLTICE